MLGSTCFRPTCIKRDKPSAGRGLRPRARLPLPTHSPTLKSVQREHALTMPGPVCAGPRGLTGCGFERDGLRPRGGRSPRTPEAHAASPERLRLRHQQRPPVRLVGAERPAFRTVQCAARQMPARPARRQRPEIAQANDAQQPHHRPRHPAAPGLPIGDRPHGHPEELRRGPATQQAGPAQFPESLRADVPQTPDRAGRTSLPGTVPTG